MLIFFLMMLFLFVWWEQSKLSRNTSFGLGCVCCRLVFKFIQAYLEICRFFFNYNINLLSKLQFSTFLYSTNSASSCVDLMIIIVLHSRFQVETPRIVVSSRLLTLVVQMWFFLYVQVHMSSLLCGVANEKAACAAWQGNQKRVPS